MRLLLTLEDVACSIGERSLFSHLSARIHDGCVYGLVGRNGAGKSTLLNIIAQQCDLDCTGEIRHVARSVAILPQQPGGQPHQGALAYLLEEYQYLSDRIQQLAQNMERAEPQQLDALLLQYQDAYDALDAVGGEAVPAQARRLLRLAGMEEYAQRPLGTLSGGERRLIDIMKLRLRQADLMLLDEPEVQLDAFQIATLIQITKEAKGGVVMVSHNRFVLDSCCTHTISMQQGTAETFHGNYSFHRAVQLHRNLSQQRSAHRDAAHLREQQQTLDRIAEIAKRNSDPAWGRRLRARRSHVQDLTRRAVRPLVFDRRVAEISFQPTERLPADKPMISLHGYGAQRAGRTLFASVEQEVFAGDRIALWGRNGCGKTTFLRGILDMEAGVTRRDQLSIGYLEQNSPWMERESGSAKLWLIREMDMLPDAATALLLGAGFTLRQCDQPIMHLSGGEKMLLRLMVLTQGRQDMLLLDEPTSHLDIHVQDALLLALTEYPGAVLCVTHDLHWLRKFAQDVWVFHEGFVQSMPVADFEEELSASAQYADVYKAYISQQSRQEAMESAIDAALLEGDLPGARAASKELVEALGMRVQPV